MTVTASYTAAHSALREVGRTLGLSVFPVRVLVEIDDLGGYPRSDELQRAVGEDPAKGSATRRALLDLYAARLVAGVASDDGLRRRRGVRTRVSLTDAGAQAVAAVRAALEPDAASRAA